MRNTEINHYIFMLEKYKDRLKQSSTEEELKSEIGIHTDFENIDVIKAFLQRRFEHCNGSSGPGLNFINYKMAQMHNGQGIIPILIQQSIINAYQENLLFFL